MDSNEILFLSQFLSSAYNRAFTVYKVTDDGKFLVHSINIFTAYCIVSEHL